MGEFVISCEVAFQAASLKNLCVPVQTVSFTQSIGKLSLELENIKVLGTLKIILLLHIFCFSWGSNYQIELPSCLEPSFRPMIARIPPEKMSGAG